MGIENGGNLNQVEEAEELAPEGSSNKGKTLESKVQQEQMEGNSEVAKESHSGLEAQEQKVEQEVTPESSPQLLQIGPDFDENWGYYDNQDKAILKLKEGNIEELKIELKNALESGQIAFSEGRLKRLDLPEEQKKIKNQLQIVESTIQALIQSNDNLPRDLRKTLQQEMVNDNGAEQINDKIQGRIELIRGRRRFRFFRIGRKEIQALERLRESIQTESNEYTKLQNLEQNIVDRDIIIKFQQLPESIQQSIYSLENPKVEDINKVIEAISIYQTPQELIDKREAAVKEIIDYLEKNNTDRAIEIRDEFGVSVDLLKSNERVQKLAKEAIISRLRWGDIDSAIVKAKAIRDEFGVSDEIVQEAAKEVIIDCLGRGDIDRAIVTAKAIRDEFGVSDEIVQEAAKEAIIYCLERGGIDSAIVKAKAIRDEFGVSDEIVQEAAKEAIIYCLRGVDIDSAIVKAKAIRDEFGVSDEIVQEAAKEVIISRLKWGDIDRAIEIRDEFFDEGESVDSLKSDKRVQEAAKEAIIYCLERGGIDSAIVKAKAIRDEFGVSEERVQEAAKEVIISRLKQGDIDAKAIKNKFFEKKESVDSLKSDKRVQEAAMKGIIYRLGRSDIIGTEAIMNEFGVSVDLLKSDERVQELAVKAIINPLKWGYIDSAIEIRDEFGVSVDSLKSDEIVQEAAVKGIISLLGSNIDSAIVKAKAIRDEFGVSDERVQEAAKEAIIDCLGWGDIDSAIGRAKAIRDEFGVSDEIVQEAAKEGIVSRLKQGGGAKAIKNKFFEKKESVDSLKSDKRVQEAAKEGIISLLRWGYIDSAIEIRDEFGVSVDSLKSDKRVKEAAKEGIISLLGRGDRGDIVKAEAIRDEFGVSEEIFQDLMVSLVSSKLKGGNIKVLYLIENLQLDDNDKKKISKEAFGNEDNFNYVLKVKEVMAGQIITDIFASKLFGHFMKEHERLSNKTTEQLQTYVDISQEIIDSPCQQIQRMRVQILSQLLETDRPREYYQKIESIFIKNNIPTVGQVYGVFETLYDPQRLEEVIRHNTSPVLQQASTRKRYYTIYQDLLKVHIESGNRSMKEYAKVLQSGEQLIEQYERNGLESLNPRQQEELRYFVGKLETLQSKSTLDTADEAFKAAETSNFEQRFNHVREGLKVSAGQTVLERVSDMYLRPAGLKSLDELLNKMKRAKTSADERGRQMVNSSKTNSETGEAVLEIKAGDLLKGVDEKYIDNILQNGSVSKEFLGESSASDYTPLDTDISLVKSEDAEGGFANSINTSIANDYGALLFVLKDRGQFQRTVAGESANVEADKLELFQTGVAGERHYGIRTGFPTTEIDFMIAKENFVSDPKNLQKIYFEIVQNGYYIPITDISGKVIFTPEMYDEYRKLFAGLEKFDGPPLDFYPTIESKNSYKRVLEITAAIPEDSENVDKATQNIRNEIEQYLAVLGVKLRPEFDTNILGAELLDTGSTGRHTNMPSDFDFDFSLKLDAKDFPKAAELAQAIKSIMIFTEDNSHQENGGYYQLRVKGVTSIGGKQLEQPLDIDIGFAKKSDLSVYGSHDAIRDKLNYIKNHHGKDAYEQAIANIILTKQILKEGHAYNKKEDGGFGGVGVENWILANGGNMEEAFKSFKDAAYEKGQRLPYEKFKEKYKILDPGTNIKSNGHDNFIDVLKPTGYEAMLGIIENYLNFS